MNLLKLLISGNRARAAQLDDSTHAVETIETPHHETHAGKKFKTHIRTTDLSTTPLHFVFTTPDSTERMHMVIKGYAAGEALLTLTEAPTGGASGGSAVTPVNRRRESSNTSGATGFTSGATAPTGGAVLDEIDSGSGGFFTAAPGSAEDRDEWVLNPDTLYSIRLTSADAIVGNLRLDWYEHADEN